MNTLIIPWRTDTGMLVRSYDVRKPESMGMNVMKNPKVMHFIASMIESDRWTEFASNLEYVLSPMPKSSCEKRRPLVMRMMEKRPFNSTSEIMPFKIRGKKR